MHSTLSRRRLLGLGAALGAGAALAGAPSHTASAASGVSGEVAAGLAGGRPRAGRGAAWPVRIELPTGFHPGGVAAGSRPFAYYGSLFGGEIYRADLASGRGEVISPDLGEGHSAAGIALDCRGRLFISGAYSGRGRVMDVASGRDLASYQLGGAGTVVADVALTADAAYFTDAFHPVLYRLPLGPRGELPPAGKVVAVELSGDWVQGGPGEVTALGITPTPDGRALIVVHLLAGGSLMRVDPATGVARRIPLGGAALPAGNGIRLDGTTAYVAQHDAIDVLRLNGAGTRAVPVTRITDPDFDGPSAVAVHGERLYVSNFGPTTPTDETPYHSTAVPLVRRTTHRSATLHKETA
ncbi:superoxide dismutase [Streptomyces sp. NPDC006283]|uniref:superoxide dismutase n=1 Tax=Streptomyces sp. NPDC006283 TaxID=3156741 RepID=UPI0033B7060B